MRLQPFLLLVFLGLSATLSARWAPIAQAQAESFDSKRKAWVALPARVDFDADTDTVRVRLTGLKLGPKLNARLDFKRLPHYDEWLAAQQAQGGTTWMALQALLAQAGDGPAIALSQEALQLGPLTVLLGLRRGSRFELIATVPGLLKACEGAHCFEPGTPVFANASAGWAWSLLKPMALQQLKAANRR